ncbi:MAG: dTDP-4-dehydrorhamnose reductase [Terracidiphilus sp.]|nr:dTDP-4-dehydrorhamnose reductase [Terracidiphilus sp.]
MEYPEVDFTHPDSIRNAVREVEPAVIVNAAAYTAVDKAESELELATAINATGPGVLAEEAKRLGGLLVHYSTDYVFDGSKQTPWVETDVPNPLNVYGRTKLAGDQAIQDSGCDHLIFRTSWVYGARGKNFLLTMLRLGKERSELRIVDDQIGSPTSSECIAQATSDVLAQVLSPCGAGVEGRSGVYNLTSSGETSWFGFTKAILTEDAARFGSLLPNLVPILTADYPTPAKRPANSRLCCERLEQTFGVTLPYWGDALSMVLDTLTEGSSLVSSKA